jgi:hypothetical protein
MLLLLPLLTPASFPSSWKLTVPLVLLLLLSSDPSHVCLAIPFRLLFHLPLLPPVWLLHYRNVMRIYYPKERYAACRVCNRC